MLVHWSLKSFNMAAGSLESFWGLGIFDIAAGPFFSLQD
jgi:hypothetical protein